MSFFSFLNKHKDFKEGQAILVDIGGGSVGASIIEFKKGEKPQVIFFTRKQIPIQLKASTSRMLQSMTGVLEDVIKETADKRFYLTKENKREKDSYQKIFCTVSSPWNIDVTRSLSFSFEKLVHVDRKFVKELLDREAEHFVRTLIKDGVESIDGSRHFEVVEKVIAKSFINGYNVKNVFGRDCSSLELFMFFSAMSKDIEKSISKICLKSFPGADIEFHSCSSARTPGRSE
jgi:hypothetical protein